MAKKYVAYWSNGRSDKEFNPVVNKCDICNDAIPSLHPEDMEKKIDMLKEIDDSYESEADKPEPRLLLCNYCLKEYLIPGCPLN